jgi:hypothetical protein
MRAVGIVEVSMHMVLSALPQQKYAFDGSSVCPWICRDACDDVVGIWLKLLFLGIGYQEAVASPTHVNK